jgi:hypothetical protein
MNKNNRFAPPPKLIPLGESNAELMGGGRPLNREDWKS